MFIHVHYEIYMASGMVCTNMVLGYKHDVSVGYIEQWFTQ